MSVKIVPLLAATAIALALPCLTVSEVRAATSEQFTLSSIGKYPDLWTGSWQQYNKPGAGGMPGMANVSLNAHGKELLDKASSNTHNFDAQANCDPPQMPSVMTVAAMPVKFMAANGMISIYAESAGAIRFVKMDGSKPNLHANPTFLGNSVGHWEGDTLVIESTGFVDDIKLTLGIKGAPGGGPGGFGGPGGGAPGGAGPGGAGPGGAGPGGAGPGGAPGGAGPGGAPGGAGGPGGGAPGGAGGPGAGGPGAGGPGAGGPGAGGAMPSMVKTDHGPNMYIVERVKLLDKDNMQITTDTYDDSVYTKPVESVTYYQRVTGKNGFPQEWFCSNNFVKDDPANDATAGGLQYNLGVK